VTAPLITLRGRRGAVAPAIDDARATALMRVAAPRARDAHLVHDDRRGGGFLLMTSASQVYELDAATYAWVDAAIAAGDADALDARLAALGIPQPPVIDDHALRSPPLHALSLAIAQKCNLGCTYCYAEQGEFGGDAKDMPLEIARAAVDLLLGGLPGGARANLAFLGGEPLLNRDVLRATTVHAATAAEARGIELTFSITTNATLVNADDGAFFERHGFSVTVSIDGGRDAHDAQRPFRGGRGSHDRVIANISPLLAMQRRMQVAARVTVTPDNLALKDTLDELVGMGFHSVGFSPMLASPRGAGEMTAPALAAMLEQMVRCGEELERRVCAGERYPFANLVNALRELHRGTHRPYPCGAGAGYLGVSADGELAACHRFVGDPRRALGTIAAVDRDAQNAWLADRHVHRQEPCRSCWARYLCGGGCHHEVIHRGRPACDYIRGWLHYCLGAYGRLLAARPDWFGEPLDAAR
jgi:uncharacterized protein